MWQQLLTDQRGMIISAELVLVLTIGVLAIIVGLSEVAVAINTELNDLSNAFGSLDQSFGFTGFFGATLPGRGRVSFFFGTTFIDQVDDCDLNTSCDIVVGASAAATTE